MLKIVLFALVDSQGRIYCTGSTREMLEELMESTSIDSNAKIVELRGEVQCD